MSILTDMGLPDPQSHLASLGLPDPVKFNNPFPDPDQSAAAIMARDKPLEDQGLGPAAWPLLFFGGGAGYKAGEAATRGVGKGVLGWLLRKAAAGGASGAAAGGVEAASRERNPVPFVAGGAAAGATLGPAVEAAIPAAAGLAARVFGRGSRVPVRAPISPVEPVETLPVAKVPPEPGPASTAVPVAPEAPVVPRGTTAPTTGPEVAQVFKTEKFAAEDPALETINRQFEALGLGTRKVRTFDDMRQAAAELGMRPGDLFTGAQRRPISDAEVVALSNVVKGASEAHAQAVEALANPALTEAERIQLTQQANGALKTLQEAIKRQVRGGTESGRSIAAFRILANRSVDPTYWYRIAQRQLGDRPFTPEVKQAIDSAIAANDRLALSQIVGSLHKAGAAEKVATLARAFMLSNPGTDVRNMGGNVGRQLVEGVADVPASALDWVLSRFTGIRSKAGPSFIQSREYVRGIRSGVEKAGEVLRHGDTVDRVMERYDFNRDFHFDTPVLEAFTQTVFRRLGAEDYLFRQPARFKSIADLAEVTAKNEGLKGRAFLDRVEQLIKSPTPEMEAVADFEASELTFNQRSAVAEGLTALENRTGPVGKLVGTAVMPFKRTPLNVAKAIVDFSPFGMPKAAIRYMVSRGQSQMLRQRYFVTGLGRSMTGTGIAGLGWALYRAGLATGGTPTSADSKRARQAQNIPNYGLYVDGKWVSVNNNAPLSNILMLGVDAAQQFDEDKSLPDKLSGSLGAGVKGLTEQTFLKGVKGVSDAASDPGRYGGKWLEGVVGIVVPSIVGATARGTDPLQRKIEGPVDVVKSRLPWARETLRPQVTALGQERANETGVLGNVFSPVRVSQPDTSLVGRAIGAADYAPGIPTSRTLVIGPKRRRTKVKLTDDELTQFQKDTGKARKEAMERVAKRPDFFDMDQDTQKSLLRRAADDAAERIRNDWKRRMERQGRAQ